MPRSATTKLGNAPHCCRTFGHDAVDARAALRDGSLDDPGKRGYFDLQAEPALCGRALSHDKTSRMVKATDAHCTPAAFSPAIENALGAGAFLAAAPAGSLRDLLNDLERRGARLASADRRNPGGAASHRGHRRLSLQRRQGLHRAHPLSPRWSAYRRKPARPAHRLGMPAPHLPRQEIGLSNLWDGELIETLDKSYGVSLRLQWRTETSHLSCYRRSGPTSRFSRSIDTRGSTVADSARRAWWRPGQPRGRPTEPVGPSQRSGLERAQLSREPFLLS